MGLSRSGGTRPRCVELSGTTLAISTGDWAAAGWLAPSSSLCLGLGVPGPGERRPGGGPGLEVYVVVGVSELETPLLPLSGLPSLETVVKMGCCGGSWGGPVPYGEGPTEVINYRLVRVFLFSLILPGKQAKFSRTSQVSRSSLSARQTGRRGVRDVRPTSLTNRQTDRWTARQTGRQACSRGLA